jgi:NAD(P)H-dependent FMN reductase
MNIGVIIGSTRKNRIGEQITNLFLNTISTNHNLNFEIIDLMEWNLPMFDEPGIPAKDEYVNEITKKWSKKINSKQGYIFVTPQYNWGYPASLKNAIDYLYKEWNNKPAIIISYANKGGDKAAAQLRQVLEGLRMKTVKTMPAIKLNDIKEKENLIQYSDLINNSIIELENELKNLK